MIQKKYMGSIFFLLILLASLVRAEEMVDDSVVAEDASATAEQSTTDTAVADTEQPVDAAAEQAIAEPESLATGTVARSAFATEIQDREPVDQVSTLTTNTSKVFFFTELVDLQGQRAIHRWEHNGELVAEVPFDVGGARWRVWSTKNLQADWVGSWKVSVVNGSGEVIASQSMQYEVAPESAAVAETDTAEESAPIADTETDLQADESMPAEGQ